MMSAPAFECVESSTGTDRDVETLPLPTRALTWAGLSRGAQLYLVVVIAAGAYGLARFFPLDYPRPGLFATLFRGPAPDRAAVARSFSGLDAVFVGHTHFDHAMDLAEVAAVSPKAVLHAVASGTVAWRAKLEVAQPALSLLVTETV